MMFKTKKRIQKEKEARLKAFLDEYKPLSQKHQIDIRAELRINQFGIGPTISFVFLDEKK